MIEASERTFRTHFGRAPALVATAPGRVNWIGEHTDYNEGCVLPLAIDRVTAVAFAPREDGEFHAVSAGHGDPICFRRADPVRQGGFGDYVRGLVAAFDAAGAALPGAELAIVSDVPEGAGLSSSAALLVALATAFDAGFALGLSSRDRADAAHLAESAFVGVPCGVMDHYASALGRAGHALRLDCRTLEIRSVALPEDVVLLVAHSGVTRRLAAGAYAQRRAECEAALAGARQAGLAPPDATALRDVALEQLDALARVLPDTPFRRARHVLTENARVDATCAALAAGDVARAGALLREGMASLRDDFAVSLPELDALCEIGDATPGVLGSRLTGAGFGGCTLHLVREDAATDAAAAIVSGFAARFARRPPVWPVRAADGTRALRL